MGRELPVEWLGTVAYPEALEIQQKRVEALRSGAGDEALLLLEHPPVITLGRRARRSNIRVPSAALAARDVEVHEVTRGGDVTYHAPGQLVGYLILDLAARRTPDVVAFVRAIEAALGEALGELGIHAAGLDGMTGVFVRTPGAASAPAPPRKIASIGIGLRRWVTYHGFALNVSVDLTGFDLIVPCGLRHVQMTSVARELGSTAPAELDGRVRDAVARAFERRFGCPEAGA